MQDKLCWCFKIKDGLKIVESNERLSKSYLAEAKSSLLRAEKNFQENDLLWTTVVIYYAEYYAIYSFLQRIGVKCENHACSILAVGTILGEEKISLINKHKEKRIDAQYYMRTGKRDEVEKLLQEAKSFVCTFDDLVSTLSEKEILSYKNSLMKYSDGKNG